MTYELDFAEEKWEKAYESIDRDLYRLKDYFFKNRKCTCDEDSCKHFSRAINKVLGKRIEESWDLKIKFDIIRHNEIVQPIIDKHYDEKSID